MLRIAICDDDKILVTQIEEMLNRYLDKKMIDRYIDIFYDGASLERIYEKGDRFDIIYLDIEMSGKNGIEAAKSIRKLDRDVLLIYVSSYETYFMQLFEVEPFRFIKKPIKETEFEEVIDLAYERTTISGNALIDGLLADKFDVARKYEIAVEYHIEIPTKLPFDDADLCIIVGNALDNAIDGTKDIEGAKKIEISMGFKQGNFLLKVKNTFNPELIKFDNNGKRLRTSKTDKSNHGMGIGLIEETALKYNGLMEITMNENLFCLSVLLYQN